MNRRTRSTRATKMQGQLTLTKWPRKDRGDVSMIWKNEMMPRVIQRWWHMSLIFEIFMVWSGLLLVSMCRYDTMPRVTKWRQQDHSQCASSSLLMKLRSTIYINLLEKLLSKLTRVKARLNCAKRMDPAIKLKLVESVWNLVYTFEGKISYINEVKIYGKYFSTWKSWKVC